MIKKYKIIGIDCANCARELEDNLKKIPGVTSLKISFLMQKLTVECSENMKDSIKNVLQKEATHFEKGIEIFDA